MASGRRPIPGTSLDGRAVRPKSLGAFFLRMSCRGCTKASPVPRLVADNRSADIVGVLFRNCFKWLEEFSLDQSTQQTFETLSPPAEPCGQFLSQRGSWSLSRDTAPVYSVIVLGCRERIQKRATLESVVVYRSFFHAKARCFVDGGEKVVE